MQHPFIQGTVISVPCSFTLHRDTATFQMECETHQKPEERGSLLKVFCPSGFYLLLFPSCLFRGLIRANVILLQQLFFKWPHEKRPQRQNKIFWGSPSDILSKWHFFYCSFSLFALSRSLPKVSKAAAFLKIFGPTWARSQPGLRSLGVMAGLSEVAGDTPLAQTQMLWGQLLEHPQNLKQIVAFSPVGVETHASFSCCTKYRH